MSDVSQVVIAICAVLSLIVMVVGGFQAWLWRQLTKQQGDLADFKIRVAERYVTSETMVQVERRLVSAINHLTGRFEAGLYAMGFRLPPSRSDDDNGE